MNGLRIAQRLTRLFSQVVTVHPWNGQDAYGNATYGAGVECRAHVQQGTVRVSGATQAMPAMYKIILGEALKVDPRDKVTLPAEYGTRNDAGKFESVEAKIVDVQYLNDSRGHVATTIMCGRG